MPGEPIDWKECPLYLQGVKHEGNLYRCKHDPESREFVKNQWAGIWCGAYFLEDSKACEGVKGQPLAMATDLMASMITEQRNGRG